MNLGPASEDLLESLRQIRRHPRISVVVAVVLAAALGSLLGIADVARRVLYAPLPYRRPARIVVARDHVSNFLVSAYNWQPNPRASSVFSQIAEYHLKSTILSAGGQNRRILLAYATPQFFSVLGVKMLLGRGLPKTPPPSVEKPVGWLPIVLSYHIWRDEFGGARNIVGRGIRLSFLYPYRFQVVGVAPPGLRFPRGVGAWVPEHLDSFSQLQTPGPPSWADFTIARLKKGFTVPAAEAAIRSWPRNQFFWHWDQSARLTPVRQFLAGESYRLAPMLRLLTGLFLALTIIAAASICRRDFEVRWEDFAIRKMLGCSPGRLMRSRGSELGFIFLAALAGCCPVKVAVANAASRFMRVPEVARGRLTLADTAMVVGALAAILVLVLVPEGVELGAFRFPGVGAGSIQAARSRGGRVPLLTAVATVILVLGAALVAASVAIEHVPTGLNPKGVYVCRVTLPLDRQKYLNSGLAKLSVQDRTRIREGRLVRLRQLTSLDFGLMVDRLKAQPGVASAGVASSAPYSGYRPLTMSVYSSRTPPTATPRAGYLSAQLLAASPGVFPALGMRVLRGRDFVGSAGDRNTVLVNRAMAAEMGTGIASLGRYITEPSLAPPARVVGIVGDVHPQDLFEPPVPTIYYPFGEYGVQDAALIFRTTGEMPYQTAFGLAKTSVESAAPGAIVSRFESLRVMVGSAASLTRFTAGLLLVLAALSLFLVGICAWADSSGEARRREHEIGIRLAVGARPDQVVRLMVRRLAVETLLAVAAGTIVAWWLAAILGYLFHGIEPGAGVFIASAGAVVAYSVIVSAWALAVRVRRCPRDLIASESH